MNVNYLLMLCLSAIRIQTNFGLQTQENLSDKCQLSLFATNFNSLCY